MNTEHLQISDMALFRKGLLSKDGMRQTSRHLLVCSDCRHFLPKPSPSEFLDALFVEDKATILTSSSTEADRNKYFAWLNGLRQIFRPAFAAALLLILTAGLSIWFMIKPNQSTDEKLIASSVNDETIIADPISSVPLSKSETPLTSRQSKNETESAESKKSSTPTKQIRPITGNKPNNSQSQKPKANQPVESETRSVDDPGASVESVNLDVATFDKGIRLSWNKVSNAAKYSVYISDLDEKLIDQFNTDTGTSYISKADFQKDIIYKWRLIVTLRSGETVSGESQRFSLNDLDENKSLQRNLRFQKRNSANIRCTEKN